MQTDPITGIQHETWQRLKELKLHILPSGSMAFTQDMQNAVFLQTFQALKQTNTVGDVEGKQAVYEFV